MSRPLEACVLGEAEKEEKRQEVPLLQLDVKANQLPLNSLSVLFPSSDVYGVSCFGPPSLLFFSFRARVTQLKNDRLQFFSCTFFLLHGGGRTMLYIYIYIICGVSPPTTS